MSRTFVAVLAAAGLLAAAPSFAESTHSDLRNAESAVQPASGGGGTGTLVTPAEAQAAVTGDDQEVTGEVVMVTPSTITMHTAEGMRRFELTPQTKETLVPVEGQTVTLYYVPVQGTAKAEVIHEASAAPAAGADAITPAAAPAAAMNEDHAQEAALPAEPPAAAPAAAADAAPVKRLPKTASDTPLIGLVGALALAGAAALRLAVRG